MSSDLTPNVKKTSTTKTVSDITDSDLYKNFPLMKKIGCPKCNKIGYLLDFMLSDSKKTVIELCRCIGKHCSCDGKSPFYAVPEDEVGAKGLAPCAIYPLHRKIEKICALFAQSDLPWRYKYKFYNSFEFGHFDKKFIRKIDTLIPPIYERKEKNLPEGLFLYGKAGTGKTILAAIIINELIFRHGVPALFMKTTRSLDRLRATYNVESSIYGMGQRIEDYYHTVTVLTLDDLGAQKDSSWVDETLYDIIDSRYEQGLFTIVSSNYSLKELKEKGAGRIASRLKEICHIIKFPDKDFREIIHDMRNK